MAISPQGYVIEKDPTSTHPFWSGSSELPSGLPGQVLEANESGEFVASDSLIDLKTETNNIKEELQTVHQDQGDIGDDVNKISGNINHLRGGNTGQVLYKTGNVDFAFGWKDDEQVSSDGLKIQLLNYSVDSGIPFSDAEKNVYVSFTNLILDTSDYYDFPICTNIVKRNTSGMQQIDFITNYHRSGAGIYIGGIIYIDNSGRITQTRLYELIPQTGHINESLPSGDYTGQISGLIYTEDITNV